MCGALRLCFQEASLKLSLGSGSLFGRSLGSFLSGGSLFGGSSGGSSFGLSLSLCGSDFSFLLSHGLGLGFVLLGFFGKTLFVSGLLVLANFVANSLDLSIFLSLPSIETLLSFFLRESALLHATLEVLHHEHALAGQDVTDGVGGDSSTVQPVESSLEI